MAKQILVNGGLRQKKGRALLSIYSVPAARFMLFHHLDMINITYKNEIFMIEPGTKKKITFERQKENHPLAIVSVGKTIPKDLFLELKSTKKQKPTQIILKDIASQEELLPFNNQINYSPIDSEPKTIPREEKIEVGCHISVFRSKKSFQYRLSLRHRISQELIGKKIILSRDMEGKFILRKDEKGRLFNQFKEKNSRSTVYMQISPDIVTKDEKELLRSKRCISTRALFSKKELEIDVCKYFINEDERRLASALQKNGILVQIPTMRKREADIILLDFKSFIEITHLKPSEKKNHHNSPHTEGIHINGRICEGYLWVSKGIVSTYFVVFDEKWLRHQWVQDLIESVKPNVFCIGTNFQENWEYTVAEKIINTLLEEKAL